MDTNNKVIELNYDLLNGYVETLGIEIVMKMITLYREQVTTYLVDIEKSLQCNNASLWQSHCHKMKGAAGSVGLKSLYEQLVLMEKTAASLNEKAQLLAELKTHNHQALASVNTWLENH